MTALVFVLGALASWRIAAAIADDRITRGFRRAVNRRFARGTNPDPDGIEVIDLGLLSHPEGEGPPLFVLPPEPHPLVILVNCVKCLGVWTSLATFAAMHAAGLAPDRAEALLGAIAAAGIVSLVATVA